MSIIFSFLGVGFISLEDSLEGGFAVNINKRHSSKIDDLSMGASLHSVESLDLFEQLAFDLGSVDVGALSLDVQDHNLFSHFSADNVSLLRFNGSSEDGDDASEHEAHGSVNEDADECYDPEVDELSSVEGVELFDLAEWEQSAGTGDQDGSNTWQWGVNKGWHEDENDKQDDTSVDELGHLVGGATLDVYCGSNKDTCAWSSSHNA